MWDCPGLACISAIRDSAIGDARRPAFQMPKKDEREGLRGWDWEAVSAPPCSSQPSMRGPRKQRMALSDTHPIRRALGPSPIQL